MDDETEYEKGLMDLYDRLDSSHEYWGDHIQEIILDLIKDYKTNG